MGLWFSIGGFRSVLCVSVFRGSFLVIVIVIDSSEKCDCEDSFWTLECLINPTIQNPSLYKFLLQCTVCAKCNWMFCLTLVISGAVEHGNHYTLNLAYEHILERTACNMTYGPFGGVKSEFSCYVRCTCLFIVCELYCR